MQVACTKTLSLAVNLGLPQPVEYWKMEEANADRIGQVQSVHLVQQFGVNIPTVAGIIGSAGKFVGTAFPYPDLSTQGPYERTELKNLGTGFTVAGWIKLVSGNLSSMTPIQYFFYDAALASLGNASLNVIKIAGVWQLSVNATYSDGTPVFPQPSTGANVVTADGVWTFYRMWFDPADSKMKLQINLGTIFTTTQAGVFGASAKASLDVYNSSDLTEYHHDEFGIWMPHLSDAQAALLYNGGAGKTCCPFS